MAGTRSLCVIIYFVWIAGWIVSSLVYGVLVKKRSAETGEPSSWPTILSRVLLLGVFWPILMLLVPFVFRANNRSKGGREEGE